MKKFSLILILLLVIPIAAAIEINLGNVEVQQTKYIPYPAEPGRYVTVWVNVDNKGSTTLGNILFKFDPAYPFRLLPGEGGTVRTGAIPGSQDQLVEYTLTVDEAALEGIYNLKLRMCLNDDCSSWAKTYELPIAVRTGGAPQVEIGLEESDIFSAGKLGYFTLNVVNRGQLDTKFLTVEVLESDKYEIIGPAEKYIGELESDDFETAKYQIFIEGHVGAKESETLELTVKIEYSDENNKKYSSYETIELKSYSANDLKRMHLAKQSSGWIWIVLVILIGIGYWWYRRRRKKR